MKRLTKCTSGTSRLDLEDYNNDTHEGLHITSMAGTWMSIVKGFAGVRLHDGLLAISPSLPSHWDSIEFHMHYRGNILQTRITHGEVLVTSTKGPAITIEINGQQVRLEPGIQRSVSFDQAITQ